MVKLGNNFSEKTNGKVLSEDGFDTIPLITPLDASQLQFPPPEKVHDIFKECVEPGAFKGRDDDNFCTIAPSCR